MQRLNRFIVLLASCFWLTTGSVAAQDRAADDPEAAAAFLKQLTEKTQAIWSDQTLSEADRTEKFRELFTDATDVDLLARGMLGRHYRSATPEQRRAYLDAMRDYIISAFDERMTQLGFRELFIENTTPAPGKGGHLFVRTRVELDEGQSLFADWRIKKKDDRYLIVNLEMSGINLMITYRDIFQSRIRRIGLDGLIEELRSEANSISVSRAAAAGE